MRILVTGGRDFNNNSVVWAKLSEYMPDVIIQGGQTGADAAADEWAKRNGKVSITCYAYWDRYGKSAGPVRNAEMLRWEPKFVLAFPGGKGTANMVELARKNGLRVIEVKED